MAIRASIDETAPTRLPPLTLGACNDYTVDLTEEMTDNTDTLVDDASGPTVTVTGPVTVGDGVTVFATLAGNQTPPAITVVSNTKVVFWLWAGTVTGEVNYTCSVASAGGRTYVKRAVFDVVVR